MIAAVALGSVLISALVTQRMIKLAPQIGALDVASARSSHSGSVPRSGGVGPFASMCFVLLTVATQVSLGWNGWLAVGAVAVISLVGLLDDLLDLAALPRLAAQTTFGAALWAALVHDPERLVLSAALLVVVAAWCIFSINAVNFMDGINGISTTLALLCALCVLVSSVALDVPDWLGLCAVGFAGAFLGFAPFNVPTAKIFLGDIGSYFLGSVVAVIGILSARSELLLMAFLAFFAVYAFDVLFTLVDRFRRGEKLMHAHRDHLYQRLASSGWSHLRVDLFVGVLIAVPMLASGLVNSLELGLVVSWAAFASLQCGAVALYAAVALRAEQPTGAGVLRDA